MLSSFRFFWPRSSPGARAQAAERFVLLPSSCELSTRESRQHLILQELERDEAGRQVTEKVSWSSSDPSVATVVDGAGDVRSTTARPRSRPGSASTPRRPRSWFPA